MPSLTKHPTQDRNLAPQNFTAAPPAPREVTPLGTLPLELVDAAAGGKKKRVVKFVKKAGPAWPLMVSMHGETILNSAAQRGQDDLIKSLIRKHGGDVDHGDAEVCED